MFNDFLSGQAADGLLKALGAADAADLIKEDLQPEAANVLYTEAGAAQFPLIKDLPTVPATSIDHQFVRVDSYGADGDEMFYLESGLPSESKAGTTRVHNTVQGVGSINAVYARTQAQTSISALGGADPVAIQGRMTMLRVWDKLNRAVYSSDTRTTSHLARFKGLYQQMDEFFATGGAHAGERDDHIVDLRGAALTPDDIRRGARIVGDAYGQIGAVYFALMAQELLEKSLDAAERLAIPVRNAERIILGANVGGMNTCNGVTIFRPDTGLSSNRYFGSPKTTASTDAPTAPAGGDLTITAKTAQNVTDAGYTSQWAATDIGADIVYKVSALNLKGESIATAESAVQVVEGGAATVAIATASSATSYKIYRNATGTSAWYCIKEISNTGGTLTFWDLNDVMPSTTVAFGLDIRSTNFGAMPKQPFQVKNDPKLFNTVAFAQLMPMNVFPLAHTVQTASNDLYNIVGCPQITVPTRQVVWINVGTAV